MPKPLIGIDLGGTNMQIGLVSPEWKMLGQAKRKTKADEGQDAVVARIVEGIEEACQNAGTTVAGVGAIGIGAPGAVDPVKGVVVEAVNLRWNDVPLAAILTRKLKVKTFLDNDVNVAVVGENRIGAGKNAKDLLGVWVGTGIGGGLILNGSLYYGCHFSAGEIGHTVLHPGRALGDRTLENACSRTAVVDRLVRLIKSNHKTRLTSEVGQEYNKIKSKTLAQFYHGSGKPDKLVCQVVDHSAHELGMAIANMVTVLSLPRVVLGGGLTEALGKEYVKRVEASVREHAFPAACKKVDVVESQLADTAGVFGAAMIAAERLRGK
ncbi:MAG TPA: ROK family protein [Phycisphaerales bacterium]|nr:ROK family protein [Phycisphaerales bacterium]